MAYDPSNIFARILRGEIPCRKVYEDEWALAFHDINPLAPVHVLVIPKGPYVSMADFSAEASDAEIAGFLRAVGTVAPAAGPRRARLPNPRQPRRRGTPGGAAPARPHFRRRSARADAQEDSRLGGSDPPQRPDHDSQPQPGQRQAHGDAAEVGQEVA